ncbi:MAG: carboxypeptidase-like regulatory domain-containing protein [Bacteroidota bacterium]
MKIWYSVLCSVLVCGASWGQPLLRGSVVDQGSGEPLIGTNVIAYRAGTFVAGAATDFEGWFSIPLSPGTYDLEVSFVGYRTQRIEGVRIVEGRSGDLDTPLQIEMSMGVLPRPLYHPEYRIPLISHHDPGSAQQLITGPQIEDLPVKAISDIVRGFPGVSVSR